MISAMRMTVMAIVLIGSCGWIGAAFCQTPPAGVPGMPGVNIPSQVPGVNLPGLKTPAIPGMSQGVPGFNRSAGTAGAGASGTMPMGQDAAWTGKRCLNRGGNSLGTCQNVCRNLGVTRASDSQEYSGVCNY